jgi:hypothetical protein
MSVFSAYLGVAGLLDVGYQFHDAAEAGIATRVTIGVRDAGQGWYSVDVVMPGNAVSVRWDSAGNPNLIAREYFAPVAAVVDTPGTTTLLSRIGSVLTITGGKVDVNDKSGFNLTAAYDPAKTAAQAGASVTLTPEYDAAKNAMQAGASVVLDPIQVLQIADEILVRDWTQVSGEADESMLNALRSLRNRWELSLDGTLTVYQEDGSTVAWTRSVQTDPTAAPVIGMS